MTNKSIDPRKIIAALICGMLGCVFMCSGDWLMMYGDTAYNGKVSWLTEGTAQIPAWRNLLSMLVAFPAIILYGIALFYIEKFIKNEKHAKIYHYLTALGMTPWMLIHLYVVVVLHVFAVMRQGGYEGAFAVSEALHDQFVIVFFIAEAIMVLPFFYWFYLQFSGKTVFPKWMTFTNVIVIYALLKIVAVLLPDTPFRIGFNNGLMSESMFIWFGIMFVWTVKKQKIM